MIQQLKKAIMTSISDVLETMFFMVLEFDEKSSIEDLNLSDNTNISGCYLNFMGIVSGAFILLIPDDQLHIMSADFMGTSPDKISEKHTSGTIKEVCNMIAGNTFSLYDDKIEFKLGIPELVEKKDIHKRISQKGIHEIFIKVKTVESFIAVKVIIY